MCFCYQFNGSDHWPLRRMREPKLKSEKRKKKKWHPKYINWLNWCDSCLTRLNDKLDKQKPHSRKMKHMCRLNTKMIGDECAGIISSPRCNRYNEMNECIVENVKCIVKNVVWFAPSVIWSMFVAPLRINLVLAIECYSACEWFTRSEEESENRFLSFHLVRVMPQE